MLLKTFGFLLCILAGIIAGFTTEFLAVLSVVIGELGIFLMIKDFKK
jgi:hypothetical protein